MLLIIEKCYSIIESLSGADEIFKQASILYNDVQIDYLEAQITFYSNPQNYCTKKAFRQASKIILELRKDWKKFQKLWNIFIVKYQKINEVRKCRKFYQYVTLMKARLLKVDNSQMSFKSTIDLLLFGIEKIHGLLTNLQETKKYLDFLDLETKKFARKFSKNRNEIVAYDKIEIFKYISEQYRNQEFHDCENYLGICNENINFETGEYFNTYEEKNYSSYSDYLLKEQKKIDLVNSIYFERIQNEQCICDLTQGLLPVFLLLDCPVCQKPYGRPFS